MVKQHVSLYYRVSVSLHISSHFFNTKQFFLSSFQIMLMSTPILREENALNSSNVAMFHDHPCFREPCQNGGRCNPQLGGYECSCQTGFSGDSCQNSESLFRVQPLNISADFLKKTLTVMTGLRSLNPGMPKVNPRGPLS